MKGLVNRYEIVPSQVRGKVPGALEVRSWATMINLTFADQPSRCRMTLIRHRAASD